MTPSDSTFSPVSSTIDFAITATLKDQSRSEFQTGVNGVRIIQYVSCELGEEKGGGVKGAVLGGGWVGRGKRRGKLRHWVSGGGHQSHVTQQVARQVGLGHSRAWRGHPSCLGDLEKVS